MKNTAAPRSAGNLSAGGGGADDSCPVVVGTYGWDGGLGSSWANDPAEDLVVVVLSTDRSAAPGRLPR